MTLAQNNKNSVALANIDFAKAFDNVSLCKLKLNLEFYGICGPLGWICNFLSGRELVAIFFQNKSYQWSCARKTSVIGALLFVLFINDITQLFSDSKCMCKLYANTIPYCIQTPIITICKIA
jgi:Reverse transcriptase (RNA-dependent DNA polymerase)